MRNNAIFITVVSVIGIMAVGALLYLALAPVEIGQEGSRTVSEKASSRVIADEGAGAKVRGGEAARMAYIRERKEKQFLREHPKEARKAAEKRLEEARKAQQLARGGTESPPPEFTQDEQNTVDKLQAAVESGRVNDVRHWANVARKSGNVALRREAVSALSSQGSKGVDEMISIFGGDVPEVTTEMLEPLRSAIIEAEGDADKLALAQRALAALTDEADREIIRDEVATIGTTADND